MRSTWSGMWCVCVGAASAARASAATRSCGVTGAEAARSWRARSHQSEARGSVRQASSAARVQGLPLQHAGAARRARSWWYR